MIQENIEPPYAERHVRGCERAIYLVLHDCKIVY